MRDYLKLYQVVVILTIVLISIIAKPHGFDDEGEISVPRSPKIQGDSVVLIKYSIGSSLENLKCDIEGTPTPTVIWLKDEKEIRSGCACYYNTTYNVTEGRAELAFMKKAYEDVKDVTGNFTCIAANFLGRTQKNFKIEIDEIVDTSNDSSSTSKAEGTTEISAAENEKDENAATTDASRLQKILGS